MEHHVNPYRIYLKATHKWVEVSREYYLDHRRYYDAFRKRHQAHGQCICPKSKFWLCDGDCFNCEFQRAGDMISLDYTTENDDGDVCSLMDSLVDPAPSVESVICDKAAVYGTASKRQRKPYGMRSCPSSPVSGRVFPQPRILRGHPSRSGSAACGTGFLPRPALSGMLL